MDSPTTATSSQRPDFSANIDFNPASSSQESEGWTVTPVWSENSPDASEAWAKDLQDILNRMQTHSILSDVLFRYVVAVLVLAWSVVLWRKFSRTLGPALKDAAALAAVVAVAACVFWKQMVPAIGFTAAYIAWSSLADMSWISSDDLPGFNAFVASLKPADSVATGNLNTEDQKPPNPTPTTEAAAPVSTAYEAELLSQNPNSDNDCIVCWSSDSDNPPLRLPCAHHVCLDCLVRLKEASRYQCPFCRTPLYSPQNTKVYIFQLAVASTGAQIAIGLVQAALKTANRQYWGVAGTLLLNVAPAVAVLRGYAQVHVQGEEGYFAAIEMGRLQVQVAASLYWVWSGASGVQKVDWAVFLDGEWRRGRADEWAVAREVLCWLAPAMAGYVATC